MKLSYDIGVDQECDECGENAKHLLSVNPYHRETTKNICPSCLRRLADEMDGGDKVTGGGR